MDRTSLRSLLMLGGGGGGASNIVTGTFKGTTAGSAIDVDIPYTGSGYPIAGIFFATGGANKGDIASLAQKYAAWVFTFSKNDVSSEPTYSEDTSENQATVVSLYKYSNEDAASSTSAKGIDVQLYNNADAAYSSLSNVRVRSKTKMSVYIASTSYGFPKDIEFTYYIIYSA